MNQTNKKPSLSVFINFQFRFKNEHNKSFWWTWEERIQLFSPYFCCCGFCFCSTSYCGSILFFHLPPITYEICNDNRFENKSKEKKTAVANWYRKIARKTEINAVYCNWIASFEYRTITNIQSSNARAHTRTLCREWLWCK